MFPGSSMDVPWMFHGCSVLGWVDLSWRILADLVGSVGSIEEVG